MQQCDVSKLTRGDKFYRVVYYEVENVHGDTVHTKSDTAGLSSISSSLVQRTAFTTDQYKREERVTRTEMSQRMETFGHAAFRVTYEKKKEATDVADELEDADMSTKAKRRKVMKEAMKGVERVMHARLYRTEDFDASMELGRYRVVDLDELMKHGDEKRALRMVDTRTIRELVVDNVRYYV
jgi:hypothetical protein